MPLPFDPPITSNYTVLTTDDGYSLRIGGGTCYTLTFGTPSGYVDGHYNWITNLDTNSCKFVTLVGGSGFENTIRLWPHQKLFVEKTIDKWSWFKAPRYQLWDNSLVLACDANFGNDAGGDGLSVPFLTPDYALKTINAELDLYYYGAPQVTIQLNDAVNTPYQGIHNPGCPVGKAGNASILMQGNASDPTKTQIGPRSGGGGPLAMFDNSLLQLKNLMLTPQGNTSISMASGAQCWLMGGIIFGDAGSTGADMSLADNSILFVDGNYSKTGNMTFHVQTLNGARFIPKINCSVNILSNCTYNTFVYAQQGSEQNWEPITISNPSHYTMTGNKWYMDTNAGLLTNGVNRDSYFPGSVNGSTGPGNPWGDY